MTKQDCKTTYCITTCAVILLVLNWTDLTRKRMMIWNTFKIIRQAECLVKRYLHLERREWERVDKRSNELARQKAVLLCNSPLKVSQLKQPVICFMWPRGHVHSPSLLAVRERHAALSRAASFSKPWHPCTVYTQWILHICWIVLKFSFCSVSSRWQMLSTGEVSYKLTIWM